MSRAFEDVTRLLPDLTSVVRTAGQPLTLPNVPSS